MRSGELKAVRNWCPDKGAPICRGTISGTWPPSAPGTLEYDATMGGLGVLMARLRIHLRKGREIYREIPTRLHFFPIAFRDGVVFVTV